MRSRFMVETGKWDRIASMAGLRRAAFFLASASYIGYFPVAPGTAGSGVGVLITLGLGGTLPAWAHTAAILALVGVGAWAAGIVERHLGQKDPSVVVVDEVAGMLLSFYLLSLSWVGLGVGFLVFRLLDILKPFPCRHAERLAGGWGIMADDLIAGVYTNVLLRLAGRWWWPGLLD